MLKEHPSQKTYDILIIGAGFSGCCLAIKTVEKGLTTLVVDKTAEYPDYFRAEKLEPDQYELLESLNLLQYMEPKDSPIIDKVVLYQGNSKKIIARKKHRGLNYRDSVNSLRAQLHRHGCLYKHLVSEVEQEADSFHVKTKEGESFRCRLLVVATGYSGQLAKSLGMNMVQEDEMISTSIGFYVACKDKSGQIPAVNFRPAKWGGGLDYATFFSIGDLARVNVFTCWSPRDERVKTFKEQPVNSLPQYFEGMSAILGEFDLDSKVQVFTTQYYRNGADGRDNLFFLGDSSQSVSPASGLGLSKCLTDVDVLLGLIEKWDRHSKIPSNEFFNHHRKLAVDQHAYDAWKWSNERSSNTGLGIKMKMAREHLKGSRLWKRASRLKRKFLGY